MNTYCKGESSTGSPIYCTRARWLHKVTRSAVGQFNVVHTETECLPLIKVDGKALVDVSCNHSWLITETRVSLEKPSQTDSFYRNERPFTELQLLGDILAEMCLFCEMYQVSCCPVFLGDLTLFTQQSAPQCCPINCMTHWMADLWIGMWKGWISCNYRESSEDKACSCRLHVSVQVHWDLASLSSLLWKYW